MLPHGRRHHQHKERKMSDTEMSLAWWGYRHVSGSAHVKRLFSLRDIDEARESDFCEWVSEPFAATDRDDAMNKLIELIP
jgi:hypothetical protein